MLVLNSMMKRGKEKAKIFDYESDAEVAEFAPVPRVEIIYEDTKEISGSEPEFKWGQLAKNKVFAENKAFASFALIFVSTTYNFPKKGN